jgi:hypothetical protein
LKNKKQLYEIIFNVAFLLPVLKIAIWRMWHSDWSSNLQFGECDTVTGPQICNLEDMTQWLVLKFAQGGECDIVTVQIWGTNWKSLCANHLIAGTPNQESTNLEHILALRFSIPWYL